MPSSSSQIYVPNLNEPSNQQSIPNLNEPSYQQTVPNHHGNIITDIISTEEQYKQSVLEISENKDINKYNEPIGTTIHRTIINVFEKLKFSVCPFCSASSRPNEVLNADLWGVLIYLSIIGISIHFQISSNMNESLLNITNNFFTLTFISILKVFFVGGFLIYLNMYYLGGTLSLFQVYSSLGYSMYSIALISILFTTNQFVNFQFKRTLSLFACFWSTIVFLYFIKKKVPNEREGLAVYPSLILYLIIVFVFMDSNKRFELN